MSGVSVPRWVVTIALCLTCSLGTYSAVTALSAGASTSSPTYYACLKSGELSDVTTTSHSCSTGYTGARWNAAGPQGATGPTGPQGQSGRPLDLSKVATLNWSGWLGVRNFSGGSYGFDDPLAIAFDGRALWVPNYDSDSVTEVNASNGSWIRTLSGGSYGFDKPMGIAFDGTHMWVANQNGNSVTEFDATNGSWIRTLSGGSYGFDDPVSIAFDGRAL